MNRILAEVSKTKMNLSAYTRALLLRGGVTVVKIEALKDFTTELKHIGNNLNQLTILAHKGNIKTVYLKETLDALNNIHNQLIRIRR